MPAPPTTSEKTELTVLSSNGVAAVLGELRAEFERASGHRLAIRYDATASLKRAIDDGTPFDLAILAAPAAEALEQGGRIAAGSCVALARSGIGIAGRAGASKPDIATTEALRRTLLAAQSVAYTTEGASGIHFAGILLRLGIAAEVNEKAKRLASGFAAELVARGEATLAVQQISELLPVAGTELIGPLPPELQLHTVFVIGLGARADHQAATEELVRFLTSPGVQGVFKAKGMDRV